VILVTELRDSVDFEVLATTNGKIDIAMWRLFLAVILFLPKEIAWATSPRTRG
jgi:hypothetical protein